MDVLREIDHSTDLSQGYLLLVDKPLGWTSFDVVKKIRGAISRRLKVKKFKVGHSGTLDPLATGLILVGIGKGTKWLHDLQGLDKTYTGTFKIGAVTATYDAEMEEEDIRDTSHIDLERMIESVARFQGEYDQVPPLYSAVKVEGQRAYKAARRGKTLELEPRRVDIKSFTVEADLLPVWKFEVSCSKGTYIRSLIHDLGQDLGVGGYLTSLRRTVVGDFRIEDSWQLEELISAIEDDPDPKSVDQTSTN